MFYTIYKTTNVVNGKFYIGKHQTKNIKDNYLGSGKRLKFAIKKYGIENFHKEILFVCESEKHMNTLEKILVVPDPELNYNLCDGGKGGFGYINSKLNLTEVRIKNLQKTRSSETIKKATSHSSETMKRSHKEGKITHDRKTFLGKKHTEETKQKIKDARKNKASGIYNSQYGTCWITNGKENKKIKKDTNLIPDGWYKGRKIPV